jgi:acid phosphatase (class A)
VGAASAVAAWVFRPCRGARARGTLSVMRRFHRLVWLGLLLSAPASAAWRSISASDFDMAPPPAKGSPAYAQDFATLLSLQASRTPAQCALAETMVIPDFKSLYGGSGILSSSEMTAVQPFMDQVESKVGQIATVFKKEFNRPRPYNEDSSVQPCVDKPSGNLSYPSEHSMDGAVDACVLGQIFPDRASRLTDYGALIGQLRVIGGVHHPSDVAAGQKLAADVCAELLQESDFNQQLAQIRSGL